MIRIFLLLFLLSFIAIAQTRREEKEIKVQPAPEERQNNEEFFTAEELNALIKAKKENSTLINECFDQMNASENRPSVSSWRYVGRSDKLIKILFAGESEEVTARLYFIRDKVTPRVSRIVLIDKFGNEKAMKGYILPTFRTDQLYEKFKKDRQDKERIQYINGVAKAAEKDGSALFNVLEYSCISEKEFSQLFKQKEVKALTKLLKEDFLSVEPSEKPWLLEVRPFEEPEM